jgi:molybdenum cofactor biosynthesis enzyme
MTSRLAIATCTLHFSNTNAIPLIKSNQMKKGDVLSVARIAGIMAAKKTSEIVPLCHNINLESVGVELVVVGGEDGVGNGAKGDGQSARWAGAGQGGAYKWQGGSGGSKEKGKDGREFGRIEITATVQCDGKTGVEMEALTAASVAGLTVYDMCKAVDKGMRIEGLRVMRKEGGKSGVWVEGMREGGGGGGGGRHGKSS